MKSNRETRNEEDIQELTLLINQLQIQQQRLERKLARVQRRVEVDNGTNDRQSRPTEAQREQSNNQANVSNRRSRNNESIVTTIRRQRERLYEAGFEPIIGDRVRIINPRTGQHPWGTIEGFCRDGKLKIHTDIGQTVTRLPKNVRVQIIDVQNV